jgi:hypothetical protein
MEIIRHAERGEALALIGCTLNLSHSTVHSVVKEDKCKEYVQNASNNCQKGGNVVIINIMNLRPAQKKIPVKLPILQGKALSLYDDWKK